MPPFWMEFPLFKRSEPLKVVPKVVPKSYRPEGQPRSAGNEFPTREVFGNSRQFQYGGFYAISNRE